MKNLFRRAALLLSVASLAPPLMAQETISAPAGFVPKQAMVVAGSDGRAVLVGPGNPLPTSNFPSTPPTPLTATVSTTTTTTSGPFTPQLNRPIWLTLSGTWAGQVQVMRSVDGGVTMNPLTYPDGSPKGVFSGNTQNIVGVETDPAASYYNQTTLTSGSVTETLR